MHDFIPRTRQLRDGEPVRVRPLRSDDGERLACFYASLRERDRFFYRPHPLTRDRALEKAARANSPTFVCLLLENRQGEIAGYAWYEWTLHAERSTFGICIRPQYQGRGAGTLLVHPLLEIADRIGPAVMGLTVQKANPRAVALYRKHGFRVVREQERTTDGEPDYYMERTRADDA